MTVQELAELLTELAETNPNADVTIAFQPGYPLAAGVAGLAWSNEEGVLYVVAEDAHGYAPQAAIEAAECGSIGEFTPDEDEDGEL